MKESEISVLPKKCFILTMSGEKLLLGNGSISHKQAVDKATDEYKKYKARTLRDVEQDLF